MNVRFGWCIVGLAVAATGLQGLMLARAELPAADAARFAAVAQSIERVGVRETWRSEPDPVGFSLWAVVVRRALLAAGLIRASDWAAPLQLASALPMAALPAMVFLLLTRMVGRSGALAGAAFFTVATDVARLGVAGTCESLLLLFQVLALWACGEYLARGSRRWLVGAGVACGAAMLVKGTSALLPAAICVSLGWEAILRVRQGGVRRSWGALLAAGFLAAGCLAVLVPAVAASGAATPQAAWQRVCGARVEEPALPLNAPAEARPLPPPAWQDHWRLENGEWMTFGKKDPQESIRFSGWLPAGWELFRELMQGLLPWGLVLAAWGICSMRGKPWRPIDRLAIAMSGVWCVAAWWYATRTGYLSTRHVLPVVVLGCGWCGLGMLRAGRLAWRVWRRSGLGGGTDRGWLWAAGVANVRRLWTASVAAAVLAAALPRTLAPFHAYRAAHRHAGLWLAAAAGNGAVLDTHAWTALYSGRSTWRFDQAERALVEPGTAWLVVEERELAGSGRRARTLRALAETGELAARFVSGTGRRQTRVAVYRWNPVQLARGGWRHAR